MLAANSRDPNDASNMSSGEMSEEKDSPKSTPRFLMKISGSYFQTVKQYSKVVMGKFSTGSSISSKNCSIDSKDE